MLNSNQGWEGFLPPRTLVMGKAVPAKRQESDGVLRTASSPAENPLSHSEPGETPSHRLAKIRSDLGDCTRCKLCAGRKNIVFGEGNPGTSLVFVGEGPGEQEDLQGRPFVGKAGQLLDRMIEAMGLSRNQVYIANVVKCRPPGNRNPEPDEIETCGPFLHRQLDTIRPKVIVALGKFAAQTLLDTEQPISKLRGKFHTYRGARLMPTFHPAYLLRNPSSKREAWADLQLVAREIGIEIPKR